MKLKTKIFTALISTVILISSVLSACEAYIPDISGDVSSLESTGTEISFDLEDIPEFTDSPYVVINDNYPFFSSDELTATSFESYSELDELGRCGTAFSCVGVDLMPNEERKSISSVKPTGWHSVKYDNVDGKNLYNRCHLIGYQLTGENANKKNLITGTRYLNVEGMLPFENMVADYVKETKNHVFYRVTPIFSGNESVARGVLMEALSVEDKGEAICFNVYCYNNQPGITIDYATGESCLAVGNFSSEDSKTEKFILNTNSKKFHLPSCSMADDISEKNKQEYSGTRESLIQQGYSPCKSCNP